ncbi:MAG: 16S rRNA (adenine(1518)-N(6)/adenine(1519)-N(6))-dimethyltransferase RsmA [Gammaproteobacteria bacterium]|nr:16S rRNA (adenine(1518)-N(6)/adenine(1519)-N(6))-dimethyltransferase RsmA [Gammaproteobacteria bacterium]
MSKPQQGHRARKRFGQNFLHDPQVIQNIIQSIAPEKDQLIAEIGPGLGALTEGLANSGCQLKLIELDRDLVSKLELHYTHTDNVDIHPGDALKFDFGSLSSAPHSLRLVGNLPYNISTPLIFHLINYVNIIQDMHFMLQKEVVQRLAAEPGNKNYGRLSVMVQYYCDVDYLFTVGPGAFNPAPKVDSAIVHLRPRKTISLIANDTEKLEKLIKQAFAQRRKTLRNNLKTLLSSEQIESLEIDPGARPETLSVNQYVALANLLSEN